MGEYRGQADERRAEDERQFVEGALEGQRGTDRRLGGTRTAGERDQAGPGQRAHERHGGARHGPRSTSAGPGSPASAPATSTVTATALTSENASTTVRWPCRSASRPTRGPHTTSPSASAPPVRPAVVSEPCVRATSSTLPNWMVAVGSRPRNDTHGSSRPVSPITRR
ncbi:hypothetical protein [Streptomyces eurythermus]|uniref:hypothetical protein n=1 Tax=Streptomyces eurythermus TaxID=42237 RepID=UPI00340E7125